MNTRKRLALVALVAVGTLAGAGVASANDPNQGAEAGQATLENAVASFVDAVDGERPEGADGLESEFPEADPRFVEGPLSGLTDGPLD